VEAVHERCCGLDVHKDLIVACLLTPGVGGRPKREIMQCKAFTRDLLALADRLAEAGCTHVAMEATGSYWKPVFNLFEDRFTLVVANARHLKAVPGRKRDVKDAEWIADLLRHGLLRPSFIPPRPQRELRELIRYRTTLTAERAAEINRIQKVLEGANIKLGSVASDVLGVSGRAMLEAMIREVTDPVALASLARGQLRKKEDQLQAALQGLVGDHQRFMLAEQLDHIDDLDRRIERLSSEVERRLGVDNADRDRLDGIPGVGKATAEALLAEIGPTLETFATADQLCSWAGVIPGMHESAGKNASGRAPRGNRALRAVVVQAAHAVGKTKSYPGARYRRLAARIGKPKAALAVGHQLLRIAFHLLKEQTTYQELGVDYRDDRSRERLTQRYTRGLQQLGYNVDLKPVT